MVEEVEARIKKGGKRFEILVDVDKALQLKKGIDVNIENVLIADEVFSDVKKGEIASSSDMKDVFGSDDNREVAKQIIEKGDIQLPAKYKKEMDEKKMKRVVNFIARNAMDPQSGNPHSKERIREAINESGVSIDNRPVEEQAGEVMSEIKKIIPIKIDTKRLKITIPAEYSGKSYGVLKQYKQSEEWLSNGDLKCIVDIPAGIQIDFYNKLNGITHGSAVVEEEE